MFDESSFFHFVVKLVAFLLPYAVIARVYIAIRIKKLKLLNGALIVAYSLTVGLAYLLLNKNERLFIGINVCFGIIIIAIIAGIARIFKI